jgi:hypothetical protein
MLGVEPRDLRGGTVRRASDVDGFDAGHAMTPREVSASLGGWYWTRQHK